MARSAGRLWLSVRLLSEAAWYRHAFNAHGSVFAFCEDVVPGVLPAPGHGVLEVGFRRWVRLCVRLLRRDTSAAALY